MPTLKLTGSKPATTRSTATRTPARKPAGKPAARRKPPTGKPAATRKPAAKPTAAKAAAATNGGQRGLVIPEGMTQGQFNKLVKDMQKARAFKEDAAERLSEAQEAVNTMAIEMLKEGVQMSVISRELVLSRQWMYKLMDAEGLVPAQSRRNARTAKKPAAKKTAARKRPAPTSKRSAPAPARRGGGRVRIRA